MSFGIRAKGSEKPVLLDNVELFYGDHESLPLRFFFSLPPSSSRAMLIPFSGCAILLENRGARRESKHVPGTPIHSRPDLSDTVPGDFGGWQERTRFLSSVQSASIQTFQSPADLPAARGLLFQGAGGSWVPRPTCPVH